MNDERFSSENGETYRSSEWGEMLNTFNIKPFFIVTYHPQANPAKRVMRELANKLRTKVFIKTTNSEEEYFHRGSKSYVRDIQIGMNNTKQQHGLTANFVLGRKEINSFSLFTTL